MRLSGTVLHMPRTLPTPYADTLMAELDAIAADYAAVLQRSEIRNIDPNRHGGGGISWIGYATHGWAPSDGELEAARMSVLARLRDWAPRFRLLFPHPTAQVEKRHDKAIKHLERWLLRGNRNDTSVPVSIPAALAAVEDSVATLRSARELLPDDEFKLRLVVDTNALLDEPDLAAYAPVIGRRYMAHILPVVLRELDDLKRAGRNDTVREAARKADRRLKGFRDNGDVRTGAKVAGDVWAAFEHLEPRREGLPSWLDLDVPDDRFVASALLLQSRHSGSALVVATSDLNMQTKLAAVALPFVEPPVR